MAGGDRLHHSRGATGVALTLDGVRGNPLLSNASLDPPVSGTAAGDHLQASADHVRRVGSEHSLCGNTTTAPNCGRHSRPRATRPAITLPNTAACVDRTGWRRRRLDHVNVRVRTDARFKRSADDAGVRERAAAPAFAGGRASIAKGHAVALAMSSESLPT